MSLNKKILALAIAGLLPGASYAVYTEDGSGSAVYAQEITFPTHLGNGAPTAPPVGPTGPTGPLGLTARLGFSVVGSSKYVRLDFPGSPLAKALTSNNFATSGIATISISQGGGVGDTFVIVELAAANLGQDALFYFDPPTTASPDTTFTIIPDAKAPHSISYRLYNSPTDAVTNNPLTALYKKDNVTWYSFGNGLDVSCNTPSVSPLKIDPLDPTSFKNSLLHTTALFNLTARPLDIDPGAPVRYVKNPAGFDVVIDDYLKKGTTFTMTGDFSFIASLSAATAPAALIDIPTKTWTVDPAPGAGKIVLTPPTTGINPTLVTLVQAPTVLPAPPGFLPMAAGDYKMTVTPGTGSLSTTPINLGTCGTLSFAGSSDRVDLALTPGQANKQWVRITNPSGTPGAVHVTVYNDAGIQSDFPLSAVKVGPAPGVNVGPILTQFSSTPLISIDAIYKAAQDATPGFIVGSGADGQLGKLRIVVRGDFGDDALDRFSNPLTIRRQDGIYIQAVSSATVYQSH